MVKQTIIEIEFRSPNSYIKEEDVLVIRGENHVTIRKPINNPFIYIIAPVTFKEKVETKACVISKHFNFVDVLNNITHVGEMPILGQAVFLAGIECKKFLHQTLSQQELNKVVCAIAGVVDDDGFV